MGSPPISQLEKQAEAKPTPPVSGRRRQTLEGKEGASDGKAQLPFSVILESHHNADAQATNQLNGSLWGWDLDTDDFQSFPICDSYSGPHIRADTLSFPGALVSSA